MVKSLILALFDFSFPTYYLSLQARMEKTRDDLKKSTEQMRVRDCSGNPAQAKRGGIAAESPPPFRGNAQINNIHGDMQQAFIYLSFSLYTISFFSISPFALLHPIHLGRLRISHVPFAGKTQASCYRFFHHPQTLFHP